MTGCAVAPCVMQGHPTEHMYNDRQKAYSLPYKHKLKLILSQTWQDFKLLLLMFVKKNEITE